MDNISASGRHAMPTWWPSLSDGTLRWVALAAMLCDHLALGLLSPASMTYALMRAIGRIAFPLFALGVARGCRRTHDPWRYLGRLLVLAVVSEVPFDLFEGGAFVWLHGQNVVWTLFAAALPLCLYRATPEEGHDRTDRVMVLLLTLACGVACELAHTDYGAAGVLLVAVLWQLDGGRVSDVTRRVGSAVAVALLLASQGTGILLAALVQTTASGRKGTFPPRWLEWLFYPVHLLLTTPHA